MIEADPSWHPQGMNLQTPAPLLAGLLACLVTSALGGCSTGPGADSGDDLPDTDTDTDTDTGEPPECVEESDCGAYEYCEQGMCVSLEGPDELECTADDDCSAGEMCIDEQCVPAVPALEACGPLELTTTEITTLVHPYAWTLGDVDSQAGAEIVAYQQGNIVSIHAGELTVSPHPVPHGGARAAVVLQADDDDAPDLLMAGAEGSAGLRIFLGDGAGGFTYSGVRHHDYELYRLARAAAPGVDALVGRGGGSGEQQVFVDPLADAETFTVSSGAEPVTGDVDGDGIDELVFVMYDDVQIWARTGDSYALAKTVTCPGLNDSNSAPALVDVDTDGLADLVCIVPHDYEPRVFVTLWSNLGDLEFAAQPEVQVTGLTVDFGGDQTATVADLEGDGDPELILGVGNFLRLGDDGRFACSDSLNVSDLARVGDVDEDGRDELVTVGSDDVVRIHGLD